MADDELWHVRISDDEVKQLTLEQIDDLYRLDVIDADTQLWQDGMDEWLPLRVVAGLDEPEVVNISMPPSVPPNLGTTMSSWPPPAVAKPSAAASSWPPAVAPSVRPPPPSSRPAPPSSRPAALAATVPSWPPDPLASPSAPPAGLFSPSQAPLPSVRPQMISPVPFNYPKPTNPLPIVLAAVLGLTITLYRNDVLHAGARSVGQESNYLKLEAALGGPGFGTPRAVEPMTKAAAALPDLPATPLPTSTSKSYASSHTSSSGSSSTSSSTSTSKSESTGATQLAATSRPEPPKASSRPAAAPATRPASEPTNAVFKQPKGAKRAKGNEFDPLNPTL